MIALRKLISTPFCAQIATSSLSSARCVHATPALWTFWERDPKGGYGTPQKTLPTVSMIRDGFRELKQEVALWSQEVKEHFEMDPTLVFRPGETDVAFQFYTPESLNRWVITSDSDHNEGYSKCSLSLNKQGRGVFSGELSTRVPKDGRIQRAGYCSMRSIPARKSFKRETYLDWTPYNMLVLKVRGDGRTYMVNLATKGYYDVMWNDQYNYVLYTRGGPYWQITKIPFSKFYLSSKGRIQDRQFPVPLNRITNIGISLGDKVEGSFQLEIDYIGLEFDPNHTEEFAYEMYKTDKYVAAT